MKLMENKHKNVTLSFTVTTITW